MSEQLTAAAPVVEAEAKAMEAGPTRRRRRTSVNTVVAWIAGLWILVVIIAALIPGVLASGDVAAMNPQAVLQPPGDTPLGTDQYGRSVLALLIHGARTAVMIGLTSTAIALIVGTSIGLLAGYMGGWVDMVVGRLVDILMSFPGVLMALIIAAALGPTIPNLILAVGIAAIPQFARVMRSQTMAVRDRLYVEAARASGFSQIRIITRHIVPNAIAPIVVLGTLTVGIAIVLAASLSYLGLGPLQEMPDWGQLLAQGQPYLASAWWMSTFSGLAITITVISISILGDGLSDKFEEG